MFLLARRTLPIRLAALLAVTTLLLVGCASSPPIPAFETRHGDRIGVLVELPNAPVHTHVGTTLLNNFNRQYSYPWALESETRRIVSDSLREAGLIPVNLHAENLGYRNLAGLVGVKDSAWQLAPNKEILFDRLRNKDKLKAIIVVKQGRVAAAMECLGAPCTEYTTEQSGLFTRSILNTTRYVAVAAMRWNVYLLDPLADSARADPLLSMLKMPAQSLGDFNEPVTFKNLSEAELQPVRAAVLKLVEDTAKVAVQTLNTRPGEAGKTAQLSR